MINRNDSYAKNFNEKIESCLILITLKYKMFLKKLIQTNFWEIKDIDFNIKQAQSIKILNFNLIFYSKKIQKLQKNSLGNNKNQILKK